MMSKLWQLLRPAQWVKNLFVLLPIFFSGNMDKLVYWAPALYTLIAFSLAAGGVYALNDVIDAPNDRLHPSKCKRPIASGAVSSRMGLLVSAVAMVIALLLAKITVSWQLVVILAVYLVMNVCYSLWLKKLAVVDVLVIAVGFVMRLLAGGMATGIVLSQWIVLMTFLLALFLAISKRRDDVLMYQRDGIMARSNIGKYNLTFINHSMVIMASVMIVCYVMYSVSPEVTQRLKTTHLYLTTIFVIVGVLRYMQITFVNEDSASPTHVLLHDRFMQLCIMAWIMAFVLIIYT
jgi:4-hydroxybenzoate polyprenyltransferase